METGMTLFESNRKSVLESIEHKKSFTLVYITIISWHDLDLSKCIDVVRRKLTLYQPKVEWYRVFDKEFLLVCHAQSQAHLISQELSNIEYLKIHYLFVQDRQLPALNYVRQVYLQNTTSDELKECSSQKITEEFEIVFQPILHHNRQLSFEALSRWRGEEMGSISPGICIPILNIESLRELTKSIIKKAVDLLSKYKEIVYVSINLSASLLKDITWLIEHLNEMGITNNNRIAFEISEEIIMGKEASENLKMIRDRGHIIFIDGFGSGSGNLNFQYMSLLPLDGVKLDRLFISGKSNKKVMELLTNIIKALDLEVIIEGVDNVEQLNTLSEAEYDSIQGYYISRPLTINELTKFMNDNC